MSHSPTQSEQFRLAQDPRSEFRNQLQRLDKMLDAGGSLSGNERNCVFLNIGLQGKDGVIFATVSGISGFDFPDDGRALALTDWDADGDLDAWLSNRTAPRIRFLRNSQDSGNSYLSLRLEGTRCNRDAIGAKVEVRVSSGRQDSPLVKVLRAGDGFLGQSTKWLHFGLGTATQIRSVVVTWPGGTPHEVKGIKPNGHYHILEGESDAVKVRRDVIVEEDSSRPLVLPRPIPNSRVVLTSRIPLPPISYQDIDGRTTEVDDLLERPLLVNIWATWCSPCIAELTEFKNRYHEIRRRGFDILAVAADGIASSASGSSANTSTTAEDARELCRSHKLPYRFGTATPECLRRLQFLFDLPFSRHDAMPIPCSFLIDANGKLAAIYRGPVDMDRVFDDVSTLRLEGKALFDAALPFNGTWYDARRRFAPLAIPADLIGHGFFDEAGNYMQQNADELKHQKGFSQIASRLAVELAQRGQFGTVTDLYRTILDVDPTNIPALNNLAWFLATHPEEKIRDGEEAVKWACLAAEKTNYRSIPVLGTLAAAYAENGQFDKAIATVDQALKLFSESSGNETENELHRRRDDYEAGRATRDP